MRMHLYLCRRRNAREKDQLPEDKSKGVDLMKLFPSSRVHTRLALVCSLPVAPVQSYPLR
ncbi:hypothetical protein BDV97DRAFT_362100 [Delphinella strobiligena]|nr:hypothetical protein BDV97DRAFT_362100 [Delphinella strobiligena]